MKSKKAQKPVVPARRYSTCSYCGGGVEEHHIPVEMRLGDMLVLFEHVPAGVCDKCGEEYLLADIQDKMFEMAKAEPDRILQVKVYSFSDPLSVAKAEAKHKRREQEKEAEPSAEDADLHLATDEEIAGLELMDTDLKDWDDL
jgi:YgiT-type zinc finger domain-containing protein